jgi:Bacterial alpha-L-rhamnosidase 6 hairpin glycosidase domain/Bacterial alpha-L-rhamnosidase C-terminal domain/Alpha-L-rhamnosidase N-terminal domain/HYR domain
VAFRRGKVIVKLIRHRAGPLFVAALLAAAAILPAGMVGGAGGALAAGNHAPDVPTGLSVGDRTQPLNVEGTPTFGWFPQDADGNEIQTAFQIQLTRDSNGASIWDSGKILSSAESYVPYAGPALADGTSYSWRVKTWDRGDLASPWSAWAHFDTGITDAEWGATWIRRFTSGNDSTVDYTLARKQFSVGDAASPVVRARAYTSAMADYELHVNGQNVYRGNSYNYPGEGQYAVTDITPLVSAGSPLAVGLLYYYHTCTCQGRANGPPTNSTTLGFAAAAGATKIGLASLSGLVVGDVITVDTGASQEVRTITAVGTAGFTTTLFAAASLGDSNIKVASAASFAVGQVITIDTGANLETATVTAVGTQGRSTTLFAASSVNDTNIKVASTTGLTVGDVITVDTGGNLETGTITAVGTQGRSTTLSAASAINATNIKVASVTGLTAGDVITIDTAGNLETATIVTVGSSGSGGTGLTLTAGLTKAHASGVAMVDPGTGITLAAPLAVAHASGVAMVDPGTGITLASPLTLAHASAATMFGGGTTIDSALTLAHASGVAAVSTNGPSGMLVKIVVDHADGTRETFVSDGTWKVTKDTAQTNDTLTRRNSDAGDYVERYDATQEIPGWDTVGFNDSAWSTPYVIGPHPRPTSPTQYRFSHLVGNVAGLTYTTVHPVSITTFADGSLMADFGTVIPAHPQIHIASGTAAKALTMQTTYRLNNTTSSAATAIGATNAKVVSVASFVVGDTITIDAPADGHGAGNPETATITSVGTTGSGGTGISFTPALTMAHISGVWVEGSRAGTSTSDTQGSTMTWFYTEKAGDQTAQAFTQWAWRYLQINAPGAGVTLTTADISAVVQHTDAPADRAATFVSDNPMLNTIFSMLQRSGLYVSQETGQDTPTREKGQFLGDSVDVAFANTQSLGERNATKRMIREFIDSQTHVWMNTQSGYCAAAPCSYNGYGVLSAGRMNAVYPNGDNMRDIPDYTEAFPDMVMRYYMESGDLATLQSAYQSMKNVADYIKANEPSSGAASGLVWLLAGGSGSYANGIIDWPSRLGYVFNNNGARTIHSEEGVAAFNDVAAAAAVLGNAADATTYSSYANDLVAQINAVQKIPGTALYSDGLGLNSTNLSAATLVGATNIKVNSVTPFTVGDSVALDSGNGALKEVRTVVAVGTTGSTGTGIDLNAALSIAHASNAAVATSSTTQLFPASATLAADAVAGDTNIKVSSVSGFSTSLSTGNAGSAIVVDTGAALEVATIATVGTAGAGGTGLTLTAPLKAAHATGAFVATPSQQAQTFAVFNGVAPQSSYAAIGDYLAAQHLKTGVMDWGITAQALVMMDRPDILLDYLTNVDQFGPARVVAQGGTFAWEDWVIGTGNNSMSHGWGARGITSMLDGLAGIQVTSPGAATVTVAPPKVGLTSVHATQWTQRGTVTSDWSRDANGMTLDVVIPVNVTATVALPVALRRYVAVGDGAPQFLGIEDGRYLFRVGSGSTHFAPDTTPPVLTVPAPITVNATGPDGAVVTYVATATDNLDPHPVVKCVPPPGAVFAIGTTTVTCTATDASMNTSSATFTVHVKGAAEQLVDLRARVQGVGSGTSMNDMIVLAQGYVANGNVAAACKKLSDFSSAVRAQSGKKVPATTATALIADATRIRAVLGCP